MLHNLTRRLGKIEKDIGKDKPVWLRLPDPENPDKTIEFVGCWTLTDLIIRADKARKERPYDQEHREST